MSLEEEIQSDIHGEHIQNLACDYCTGTDTFIGADNVLIDVIKVVDLPLFERLIREHPQFEMVPEPPNGWMYDALRCSEHISDSIDLPTDGYEEALVYVDLMDVRMKNSPSEGNAVTDATELTLVDYSESSHGADPPKVEGRLMHQALVERRDYGYCRISRQERLLPTLRKLVSEDVMPAEYLEGIEKAVKTARNQ